MPHMSKMTTFHAGTIIKEKYSKKQLKKLKLHCTDVYVSSRKHVLNGKSQEQVWRDGSVMCATTNG